MRTQGHVKAKVENVKAELVVESLGEKRNEKEDLFGVLMRNSQSHVPQTRNITVGRTPLIHLCNLLPCAWP